MKLTRALPSKGKLLSEKKSNWDKGLENGLSSTAGNGPASSLFTDLAQGTVNVGEKLCLQLSKISLL